MQNYTCPVCGYTELNVEPYDDYSLGSLEMCQCCGFHFGVTDDDCGVTHLEWRKVWIARGMPWSGPGYEVPENWSPKTQLEKAGLWPFNT